MPKYSLQNIIITAVLILIVLPAKAQQVNEPKVTNPKWVKPYPAFRIGAIYIM
jgi:hypothetical protein